MKHPKLIISTFLVILISLQGSAQVVFKEGTPPSFSMSNRQSIPVERLPKLDYDRLIEEDERREEKSRPFKFGHLHRVNFSLDNSGQWMTLPDGNRIWQLRIYAPEALTINLNYDKYELPIGSELYIYNDSKTNVLGPFTNRNQKANQEFATGFTEGEYCTLEYYEPSKQLGKGVIEINGVVHGYRSIRNHATNMVRSFQSAGPCNYDVGCSLGNGWEDQIKSVAMILTEENTGGCTGTLINTTANDCMPYMITADHCFEQDDVGDTLSNIFLFNYDSPNPICPGISQTPGPVDQTTVGCTIISKSQYDPNDDEDFYVDFCLLRLENNPIDFYDVYYSGWDRRNIPSTVAVGIHHGSSDVKKISKDDDGTYSSNNDVFWHVRWESGTTEAGASGSALFDGVSKRIIGQLSKGDAACDGNNSNNGEEDFGKIYWGWDMFGTDPSEQLKPWLDPINSGALFVDGNNCASAPVAATGVADGSNLNLCTPGNIRLVDQSTGLPTSWLWTFSGVGVSPASSTLQNPEVTITSSGTLTATLMVTNALGSDMITDSYTINIVSCDEIDYCETVNMSIPDNTPNGISHDITVPTGATLIDVDIEVDVEHPYVGDLIIKVEHGNKIVTLLSKPNQPIQLCGEEDIQATFDDNATQEAQGMCEIGNVTINGDVLPLFPLSVFYNTDPTGIWTISISDGGADDIGQLISWCVEATTTNAVLPIELLEFTAVKVDNEKVVKLNWVTTSEIDNDFFIVEQSTDAQNWQELGKVDGNGTISTISTYEFIDDNPSLGKTNYYRLKQVDLDGTFGYSAIRSVDITTLDKFEISIYPNPILAGSELKIYSLSEVETINLYTTWGQRIEMTNSIIPENVVQGIYVLEVVLKSGRKELSKLIVN